MPSFLVNRKMNRALATRIKASLGSGSGVVRSSRLAPNFTAVLRIVAIATALGSVGLFVNTIRERRAQIERVRSGLLESIRSDASALSPRDLQIVERAELALKSAASAYEGDLVLPELRQTAGLSQLLARPSLYVRGRVEDMRSSSAIASSASDSGKDAFLLCLVEPPAEKDESHMLKSVQAAYFRKASLEQATSNIQRLGQAIVGLPWLTPTFVERVRNAPDGVELSVLKQRFEAAPTKLAAVAAKAEVLIFLQDEPKERGGTELDGANLHHVRVGIVELEGGRTLLRLRRRVDPAWVSEKRRSRLAREFNGCRLALEVREELLGG